MTGNLSLSRKLARGAASVEAVVVLPVFVVLFVAVFFVRDLIDGKIEAEQRARRCAWEYSANGCDSVPPGCQARRLPLGPDPKEVKQTWDDGKKYPSGGRRGADKFTGAMAKAVSSIGELVFDSVTRTFTLSLQSTHSVERARPPLFGGGVTEQTSHYRMACNLKSTTKQDVVNNVWNLLIPWK